MKRSRQRIWYLAGVYGPALAKYLFPNLIWKVDVNGRPRLFLTFDDGPTPHLTPQLLETLGRHDVSATFFLLGKHVVLDPDAVRRIEGAGHRIGLHGFDHLDAWKTARSVVSDDLERGYDLLASLVTRPLEHFRPPFGRFRGYTLDWARSKGLNVVMWDVMPGDFMIGVTHRDVVGRVRQRVRSGSIIVLHDSWNPTVVEHTGAALEALLPLLKNEGWCFESL